VACGKDRDFTLRSILVQTGEDEPVSKRTKQLNKLTSYTFAPLDVPAGDKKQIRGSFVKPKLQKAQSTVLPKEFNFLTTNLGQKMQQNNSRAKIGEVLEEMNSHRTSQDGKQRHSSTNSANHDST